jgi:hypothetical protein
MKVKFKIIIKHFPFFNKIKSYNKKLLNKNKIKVILLKLMIVIIKELKFSKKKSIMDNKIKFFNFILR